MGKRRSSTAEDIIELASRLPWWAGVLLALIAYVLLHAYAQTTELPPKEMAAFGEFAGRSLYRAIAKFVQFILPALFLIGALASFIKQLRRETPAKVEPMADSSGPAETGPACPVCGVPMVNRVARQGSNVGRSFWGCVRYPNCRGTRAG